MSKNAFYQQVEHQEELHEKQALESSKEALAQYEVAYSMCEEILFDIEENIDLNDDIDREAVCIILFRIMGTLQSIKWLLLKGHYYDAAVLDRSFMESLGTCCYILQNRGIGEKWFKEEKFCTSLDKFKAIAKTLKVTVPEKDTEIFYRQLCMFVHGNKGAIKTLISEIEDENNPQEKLYTVRFSNPSVYNKKTVDYIATRPLITLLVISEAFSENIWDFDKKIIEQIKNEQFKTLFLNE